AGDIGTEAVADALSAFRPLLAVHGNIDGAPLRMMYPEHQLVEREGLRCLLMHIGGYPGRYSSQGRDLIRRHRPGLFISGHSHILKAMPDPVQGLLHLNPGAAGYQGMHHKITLMRFRIAGGRAEALEVFETERKRI
ncbi:MAG TPA: metallophosphoesterase family protein, partial [Bacteroidales bacterium]|nr:metallophosphoesterase family protein [Bacteroidales bacterium]